MSQNCYALLTEQDYDTATMRALMFHGPGQISLESVPIPKARTGEVVIRVGPPSVEVPLDSVLTEIRDTNPLRPGGAVVSGIVIKNPFFKNPKAAAKLDTHKELLAFGEPENLICTLDDWFDASDEVDVFEITGLETVMIGEAVLLHPRCTWKN